MLSRRRFVGGVGGAWLLAGAAAGRAAAFGGTALTEAIEACERGSGGRLGVAVLDVAGGRRFAWRGDERFPLCSTFKLLLAAAVLRRVDGRLERLERKLPVAAGDILPVSPFTAGRVGKDAGIGELCRATMIFSDNAAANLLLATIGGPAGLTRFVRAIGDPVTRLDRDEPTLGTCIPGDPRDTTSPRAMIGSMERILLGRVLSEASRTRIAAWLADNRTGAGKLRDGMPGWRVGDKTGGGENGTSNDVAIAWAPLKRPGRGGQRSRGPVLIASYLTLGRGDAAERNAVHAAVGRAVATAMR